MSNQRPQRHHDDLLESLIESLAVPATTGRRGQIQQNALNRENTPTRWGDNMAQLGHPPDSGTLWIVDRILGPDIVAHFMSFMGSGVLPGGAQTALPILEMDVQLITQPFAEWAPAPHNHSSGPIIVDIMSRIGSSEDSSRLQLISKNMHAMKSRILGGVMPVSDRRWAEKKLDEPENFNAACQLITEVLNVFHYLNDAEVKSCLRETYNLIWDHLKTFEDALNAKRASESQEPVSPTALWANYIRELYAHIEITTHDWVCTRLTRIKDRVLRDLVQHQPQQLTGEPDQRQWQLTNMWQDLTENMSHADYAIFLPMDGYKGCSSPSATKRPLLGTAEYTGTTPLHFSPDMTTRRKAYHMRRRHMFLMHTMNDAIASGPSREPLNSPTSLATTCRQQAQSQDQARLELRGPPPGMGQKEFVRTAEEHSDWGFVAYRGHHGHTDAEWAEFRAMFDADASNWGNELMRAEQVKARSNIHWLDVKELGLAEDDVEALKSHFGEFKGSEEFPSKFRDDVFLLADKASIDSYLKPMPEAPTQLLPPGDMGGFIVAVDQDFVPSEGLERPDESPGYDGTLRLLPSLLWDDFSALMVLQSQFMEDLWPLAMDHPLGVYVGPVVKKQVHSWRSMRRVAKEVWTGYMNWEKERGAKSTSS